MARLFGTDGVRGIANQELTGDLAFRLGRAAVVALTELGESRPEIGLYVTPVHIDPTRPSLPISHSFQYAVYLGKLLRPFATLGFR